MVLTLQAAWAQGEPGLSADEAQPVILDVRINGQAPEAVGHILRRGTQLLFGRPDLEAWRLVVPASPVLQRDGIEYHDLNKLPGVRVVLEESSQTALIYAPSEAFVPSRIQAPARPRAPLSDAAFGLFLNYDVALQNDRRGNTVSSYFDAAASGDWGGLASSLIAGQTAFGNDRRTTRLDTAWRIDAPDRLTRLTVGDAISRSAAWSSPLRFGGLQFGTRFGLQAGYISYPTPTLHGGSAVPSAIEVYVNDTLRYQGQVDQGPFAISDVPVLTGAGEMHFAVTDAFGVQRTVTMPYYVSPGLLREDLSDYSVEFGWNRLQYGERSFDYGRPFAAGNWRKGLNDAATLELHAEAGARSQTAGAGLQWVWATLGEFGLHAAASRSADDGSGLLARAAYARSSGDWNFAASRQVASRDFTQIGWQDSPMHVSAQSQMFAGRSLKQFGSLGGSYTLLRYNSGERAGVMSAVWSIAIADRAWLSTYVARTTQNGQRATPSVGATLTVPLGERQSAFLSSQRDNGRTTNTAEFSQAPPADSGYGYRLRAAQGDTDRAEASLDWRGRYGMVAADVAHRFGDNGLRLRASGALGHVGGVSFATRQSNDAFALVTVPGAAGVQVYRENQPWAITDSEGRVIVSGLRAYEPNRISIDNGDLPIEIEVRNDVIFVVPRDRGVAMAAFDISRDTLATLTVLLPDGSPLPPGIDLRSATRAAPLMSGYQGAVMIRSPRAGERFEARWRGGHCSFALDDVTAASVLPSWGPYTCAPVAETAPRPAR